MEPTHHWNVGEPRLRPDGSEIVGSSLETYWSCRVVSDPNDASFDLPQALESWTSQLEKHRDFLREFALKGGDIEFFIGWFVGQRSGGDVLNSELLKRLGDLGINLSLDVYRDSITTAGCEFDPD